MMNTYLNLKRKAVALLALSCLFWVSAQAQQSVSGKITDAEDGSGIPGVNVIEQGTTNGTITDFDGNYQLNVSEGASLSFSYVGYKTQEMVVGSQSVISIGLELDVQALSEIVVVGYGTAEKKDATGALSTLKEKDFNQGVISSPEQLFAGKMAGVQVTSNSGEPGAGINIRIRGTSSVRSGNNPLFVVDGVPLAGNEVSSGTNAAGLGSSDSKNPLNFLNPDDILSVDVLKDASATAIYGSRGANGVVLITTKGGRAGSGNLSYSGSLGFSTITKKYDLLGPQEFLDAYASFNGAAAAASLDGGTQTDWQDEIFQTGITHNHNLSYGAGSDKGDFRFSMSYMDQEGIVKTTGLERLTFRFNGTQRFIDDRLTISTQVITSTITDGGSPISNTTGFEGDLLGNALKANPTNPVYITDANGDQILNQPGATEPNPVALLDLTRDFTNTLRTLGNISADIEIIESLHFKTVIGYDRSFSSRTQAFSPLLNAFTDGFFGIGGLYINDVEQENVLWENYFTFDKTFGSTKFNALAGYSYQDFQGKTRGYEFSNFRTNDLDIMINNFASANQGSGASAVGRNSSFEEDEIQSFFARATFDVSSKYLFTATVRADGSTKFGSGNTYGTFPSGAFKWRISEESFAPAAFTDLALRVGYGITGNQEIPHNRYTPRQRYGDWNISGSGSNFNGGGLGDVAFANPNLKWESTSQLNIGIDFGVIDNRLTGSLDYYTKNTNDLLIQVQSAQPASQPFVWQNLDADIVNNGVEIQLNFNAVVQGDFQWDINWNLAYNKNEVKNFGGLINTGTVRGQGLSQAFAQRIAQDQPLYSFFLRDFAGYDENGITVYNDGDFQQFFEKGALPTTTTGLINTLRYKKFDLSLLLYGQFGNYVYNNTANAYFTAGALANGRNVSPDVVGNGEANLNAPDVSTRFLEKGDFIRIQNLSIGWNAIQGGGTFQLLRISLAGQNIATFTDYSGQDPEVNVENNINDVPSFGLDYTPYPRARVWTLGVNAVF